MARNGISATRINDIPLFNVIAITIPPTNINGERINILRHICTNCTKTSTSFVALVIIEAVVNLLIFANENVCIFRIISFLKLAPNP